MQRVLFLFFTKLFYFYLHLIFIKTRAENVRNLEYNYVKDKLDYSEKSTKVDWWKDHNSPDVKPYSVSL
jgi:hypothetical protein